MDVLHLSTYDLRGGASRAALRLHRGLCDIGVSSRLLVQVRELDDPDVLTAGPATWAARESARLRAVLDLAPTHVYRHRPRTDFSPNWLPDQVPARVRQLGPSIVNLHWISAGFLSVDSIARLGRPIVWTLHDMWAFTGGCHYSGGCRSYEGMCGKCPQLSSRTRWDLSRLTWRRKMAAWRGLNVTVTAPSEWLAQCARSSSLLRGLRIEVIPLGIDTTVYRPVDRRLARQLLGLPEDRPIILFGALGSATDGRKGRDLLETALNRAGGRLPSDAQLVVFGSGSSSTAALPAGTRFIGHLQDDVSLTLTYAAADVMIVPSREDNFPLTALEAMACGTPIVCFDASGLPDLVDHMETGYRARAFDTDDLVHGIAWVLEDAQRRSRLAHRAREKTLQKFTIEIQARAYLRLYEDILKG